jgi:ribosomal protein S18 acetylase RimI-like enzyme
VTDTNELVIRRARCDDVADCLDVVVAAGMFTGADVGVVDELLGGYFIGEPDTAVCFVGENAAGIGGVAYAQPAPGADRVWYLTMIGVRPTVQRSGIGGALLDAVERTLVDLRQRLLLVETSALPEYLPARNFYSRSGYDEEARVRDFHEDGDDMVLFRKRLTAARTDRSSPSLSEL